MSLILLFQQWHQLCSLTTHRYTHTSGISHKNVDFYTQNNWSYKTQGRYSEGFGMEWGIFCWNMNTFGLRTRPAHHLNPLTRDKVFSPFLNFSPLASPWREFSPVLLLLACLQLRQDPQCRSKHAGSLSRKEPAAEQQLKLPSTGTLWLQKSFKDT